MESASLAAKTSARARLPLLDYEDTMSMGAAAATGNAGACVCSSILMHEVHGISNAAADWCSEAGSVALD
jgi:hypothetical protein